MPRKPRISGVFSYVTVLRVLAGYSVLPRIDAGPGMARLAAAKGEAIGKPGMHGDGNGLCLRVTGSGPRSWMRRIVIRGRRRDPGPGGHPATGPAEALALANEAPATAGRDPPADVVKRGKSTPRSVNPRSRSTRRTTRKIGPETIQMQKTA